MEKKPAFGDGDVWMMEEKWICVVMNHVVFFGSRRFGFLISKWFKNKE